ncbi:MAG: PepSY-like domain-containing protein [Alistipes sp.]
MKKLTTLFAALVVVALTTSVFAKGRPITVAELPAAAQQFLKSHFANHEVSYVTMSDELFDKDYKVVLADGCRIEFAKDGTWEEVDCKRGTIPAAIVPQQISDYMIKHHPKRTISSIERDRRGYEVKTDNGLELEFNQKFALIEVGD